MSTSETKFVLDVQTRGLDAIKKLNEALRKAFGDKKVQEQIIKVAGSLSVLSEAARNLPSAIKINLDEIKGFQVLIDFVEKYQIELRNVVAMTEMLEEKTRLVATEFLSLQKKFYDTTEGVTPEEHTRYEEAREEFKVLNQAKKQLKENHEIVGKILSLYDQISDAIRKGWIRDIKEIDTKSEEYYNKTITKEQELARKRTAEHRLILKRAHEALQSQYKDRPPAEKAKITRIGTHLDVIDEPGVEDVSQRIEKIKGLFESLGVSYIELAGKSDEASQKMIKDLKAVERAEKERIRREPGIAKPSEVIYPTAIRETEQRLISMQEEYRKIVEAPPLHQDQQAYNEALERGTYLVREITQSQELLKNTKAKILEDTKQEIEAIERKAKLLTVEEKAKIQEETKAPEISQKEEVISHKKEKQLELERATLALQELKKTSLKELASDNLTIEESARRQREIIEEATRLSANRASAEANIVEVNRELELISQREKEVRDEIAVVKRAAAERTKGELDLAKQDYKLIHEIATQIYPTKHQINEAIHKTQEHIFLLTQGIAGEERNITEQSAKIIKKKLEQLDIYKVTQAKNIEARKLQERIEKERADTDKDKQFRERTSHKIRLREYKQEEEAINKLAEEMLQHTGERDRENYEQLPDIQEKYAYLVRLARQGKEELRGYKTPLDTIGNRIEKKAVSGMQRFLTLTREATKNFFSIERLIQRISFVITAKLSYDIFDRFNRSIRRAISNVIEFEDMIARVSTILVATERTHLSGLRADTVDLMARYGQAADVSTRALYDILSAQIDVSKSTYVLEQAMKAAVAGFSEAKTAADLLTTVLNAYNLEAERAGDVSDWLFTVVRLGKTTLEELGPVLGRLIATTGQMQIPLEDVGTAIAMMTRAGVRTNVAITSLNQLFLNIAKPNREAMEIMRKYNVELSIAAIRKQGLAGVMAQLQGLTEEEMVAIASSRRGFMALANAVSHAERYYETYLDIINRTGVAQDAFEEQASTLQFKISKLGQEVYAATLLLTDFVLTLGTPLIEGMSFLFRSMREYEKTFKAAATAVAALIAYKLRLYAVIPLVINGINAVTKALYGLIAALFSAKAATLSLKTAGAGILAFLKKFLPVLLAIGAVVYVFSKEKKEVEAMREYQNRVKGLNDEISLLNATLSKTEHLQRVAKEYKGLISHTQESEIRTQRLERAIAVLSRETGISADRFRDLSMGMKTAEEILSGLERKSDDVKKSLRDTREALIKLEMTEISRKIREEFEGIDPLEGLSPLLKVGVEIEKIFSPASARRKQIGEMKEGWDFIAQIMTEEINLQMKLRKELTEKERKETKERLTILRKANTQMIDNMVEMIDDIPPKHKEAYRKIISYLSTARKTLTDESISLDKEHTDSIQLQVEMAKGSLDVMIEAYRANIKASRENKDVAQENKVSIYDVVKSYDKYIEVLRVAREETKHLEETTQYYDNAIRLANAEKERATTLFELQTESIRRLQEELSKFDEIHEVMIKGIITEDIERYDDFAKSIRQVISQIEKEVKGAKDIEIIQKISTGLDTGEIVIEDVEKMIAEITAITGETYEIALAQRIEHDAILENLRKDALQKYLEEKEIRIKSEKEVEQIRIKAAKSAFKEIYEGVKEFKPEIEIDFAVDFQSIQDVPYKTLQQLIKDPDLDIDAKFLIELELERRDSDWERLKEDLEYFEKSLDDIRDNVSGTYKYFSTLLFDEVLLSDDLFKRTKAWGELWKKQVAEVIDIGAIDIGISADEFRKLDLSKAINALKKMEDTGGDAIKSLIENFEELEKEASEKQFERIIDATRNLISSLTSLWEAYQQRRLRQIAEERDEAIKSAETRAEREGRSALWLEREKERIGEEAEKREREVNKRLQKWSLAQVAINTAVSIAKAFAEVAFPLSLAVAAMYAASGVAQAQIIAMQEFAEGGLVKGPGGPKDDKIPIRVSDGEIVVQQSAAKGNEAEILRMNEELAKGKSFGQYALEHITKRINNAGTYSRASSAMKRNFATGGIVTRNIITEKEDFTWLKDSIHELSQAIQKEPIEITLKAKGLTDEEISRKVDRGKGKRLARGM